MSDLGVYILKFENTETDGLGLCKGVVLVDCREIAMVFWSRAVPMDKPPILLTLKSGKQVEVENTDAHLDVLASAAWVLR